VSVDGHHDDRQKARRRQLLAMHALRRNLEPLATPAVEVTSMSPYHAIISDLQELIGALDRRVPQVQRAGELSIARAAAALRLEAVNRIEELERIQAEAERRSPVAG
jgi:hypothetical protein